MEGRDNENDEVREVEEEEEDESVSDILRDRFRLSVISIAENEGLEPLILVSQLSIWFMLTKRSGFSLIFVSFGFIEQRRRTAWKYLNRL